MYLSTLTQIGYTIKDGAWRGTLIEVKSRNEFSCSDLGAKITEFENLFSLLRHGDKVIIKTTNTVNSVCAMLFVWGRGGVVVPVKNTLKPKRILNIAADSNAKYILDPDTKTLSPVRSYKKENHPLELKNNPVVSGVDLALIVYTSGSTGKPKGIMLSHSNVIFSMYSIISYLGLQKEDVILNILPFTFDYGLYQVLFSFASGLKTVLHDAPLQPYQLINLLNEYKVSVLPVVPSLASMLEKILKYRKNDIPELRKLTNTGGHLSTDTIKELKRLLPQLEIYPMYGLTECKRALYLPPADLDKKMGSVGIPIPGLDARVFVRNEPADLDKETNDMGIYHEASPNEIGELFVRGPSVMQGYCHEDESSVCRLYPGRYRDEKWLKTGDLFIRDEDGYFYFKGRSKELIKQGGYCLYPAEIEEVINQHDNARMVSVVGETRKDGLEYACAFVELSEDNPAERNRLLFWLKEGLESDYSPRAIFFINAFPYGSTGKIDKKRLIEEYKSNPYTIPGS
ncbi:acyl-CoA synthetase (AMP-forming)/AMP-acid ligase II [Desulfosalsimonas propionicica]|uniref:Acyl-CoA synthetase (AMP-forming)/AMP-acid ligase II n=1 Tax=Desulfosalsimonas propionicica TaxID=332175 RepID=A0A7W0C9Y2_9BACT|nr:class I adenylate-forming enzyme family protein [Desulfosalsimonas propionicica]MBA2881881.1 acyl-CoA synthetase (AMP-forming)/AMP-acid ligase II [Desulfosalsimonas propionicica]